MKAIPTRADGGAGRQRLWRHSPTRPSLPLGLDPAGPWNDRSEKKKKKPDDHVGDLGDGDHADHPDSIALCLLPAAAACFGRSGSEPTPDAVQRTIAEWRTPNHICRSPVVLAGPLFDQ